jgi:hypothetical protein
MKQLVSFPGILRGAGHEARCTVLATQLTLPGGSLIEHTDYSIRNISPDLPDGQYVLFTNGETITVTHCHGSWLQVSPIV